MERPVYLLSERPVYLLSERPVYLLSDRPVYLLSERPVYLLSVAKTNDLLSIIYIQIQRAKYGFSNSVLRDCEDFVECYSRLSVLEGTKISLIYMGGRWQRSYHGIFAGSQAKRPQPRTTVQNTASVQIGCSSQRVKTHFVIL